MTEEQLKEAQFKLEKEKFKYQKQKDEKEFDIKKKESKFKRFDLLVSLLSVCITIFSLFFAYSKDKEVDSLQKQKDIIDRLSQKMIIDFSAANKSTHDHQVEIVNNEAIETYSVQIPYPCYSVINGFPKSTFCAQIFDGNNITGIRTLPTGDFFQHFNTEDGNNKVITVMIEPLFVPGIKQSETNTTYFTYYFVNIVDYLDNNNFYVIKYEFSKENDTLVFKNYDVINEKNIGIISESVIREDFNEFIKIFNSTGTT